jgi:hypothetical protein
MNGKLRSHHFHLLKDAYLASSSRNGSSILHRHLDLIRDAWEAAGLSVRAIAGILTEQGLAGGVSHSNLHAYISRCIAKGLIGAKGCRLKEFQAMLKENDTEDGVASPPNPSSKVRRGNRKGGTPPESTDPLAVPAEEEIAQKNTLDPQQASIPQTHSHPPTTNPPESPTTAIDPYHDPLQGTHLGKDFQTREAETLERRAKYRQRKKPPDMKNTD